MGHQISPEFHAEIIITLFNDCKDLRKVKEKARILLSGASPDHLDDVSRNLPEHLLHLVPPYKQRAA